MKTLFSILAAFGCAVAASAQPTPLANLISVTLTRPGPIAVGQTITVSARMSLYSGPPADGFGFLVNYNPYVLSFVSNSFNLGSESGPDQQWLTKPNQEGVGEGYQPQAYCDGSMPGSVLASLGDVGRGYPPRGTVAQSGFLVSFQLVATVPGTSLIMPTNYGGLALYNTSHQAIPSIDFRGATIVVRDTDIIPEVSITSPTEGTVLQAPDKIVITATAAVTDGQIAKVEFFADDLPKLGEATNAPYKVNWLSPSPGQHSLLAIATDNFDGTAASVPVQILVNALPSVAITNPAGGAWFTASGNIAVQASANDSDGTLDRVEFYAGGTLLGTDTNAPFAFTWTNVAAGTYFLTARAVDNLGGATVSSPVSVIVRPSTCPPQVASAGTSLLSESGPTTGGVDPGETVTIQCRLRNTGGSDTANLVATLQSASGIVSPSGPQTYGVVTAAGPPVGQPFSFTAYGSSGGRITAWLQLQDGTNNLGMVSFPFTLGGSLTAAKTNAITILDNGPAGTYPSTNLVAGVTGLVDKVTVTLSNLSHTFPGDIDALLVGPGGQKVLFMSDAGGSGSITNVTLAFADDATNVLPYASTILPGSYRPTDYEPGESLPSPAPAGPYSQALSAFRGADPNGNWLLYLADDTASDIGQLTGGWSLTITTFDPVDPVADLVVAVGHAPEPVGLGGELTLLTTVTNAGPEEALGLRLTNTLPAEFAFVSAISSQGSWSNTGAQVVCDLGPLAAGAIAEITIAAVALDVGTFNLLAAAGSAAWDFNPPDNFATNLVAVSEIADLSVAVQASPVPVYLNNTLTYTVTASNAGPYPAAGVVLSDTLPAGATFVSATASQGTWTNSGGIVTASLGSLATGDAATLTITCTSPDTVGQLTNLASVWAASPLDPLPENNSANLVIPNVHSAFVIVPSTALLVAEASPPSGGIEAGETVSVCFYLRNIGSANTTNLTATLLAAGGVLSPGGAMNYGAVTTCGPSVGRTNTFTAATNAGDYLTAILQLQEGSLNLGTVEFYFALGNNASFSDARAITILDNSPASLYPSTIFVSGLSGVTTKATATLSNLNHTFVSDLDILLVGPSGQKVILMSGAGTGPTTGAITITFDDAATNTLQEYSPPSAGRYRPADFNPGQSLPLSAPPRPYSTNLSAFVGLTANGGWSLYVADEAGGDAGSLGGWSLDLTTAGVVNPPPPLWECLPATTNAQPRFLLCGRTGDTWQIDASSDLVNWTTILTNTLTTNSMLLLDPAATNIPSRFYRAVWRP